MALLGDLAVEPVEDRPPVPQRAVADAQRFLAAGEQVGDELVDRADPGRRHLLHAARHLAVHRVEHLALAGVDHRHHDPVGAAVREGEQIERRDADHRQAEGEGEGLARGEADPHPGEQARSDVDGDHTELVEPDVGLRAHEVDGGSQDLGVPPPARDLEHRDHALVAAERHADLLGRGLDAERQHRALDVFNQSLTASCSPSHRHDHERPTGTISMTRASASSSTATRRTTR